MNMTYGDTGGDKRDNIMNWKHLPHYWLFAKWIPRVFSSQKIASLGIESKMVLA